MDDFIAGLERDLRHATARAEEFDREGAYSDAFYYWGIVRGINKGLAALRAVEARVGAEQDDANEHMDWCRASGLGYALRAVRDEIAGNRHGVPS